MKHQLELKDREKEEQEKIIWKKAIIQAEMKAKNESNKEMNFLKEHIEEQNKKLDEARDAELELRKKTIRLEEKEKEIELKAQRAIDEQRKKIIEDTYRKALEENRFKDLEKNKVINDLKKSLEEARLKANQGSQQTQGEVLELDLEDALRKTFPTDIIEPIKKGERGADIRQTVKTLKGNSCGVILWESKRTKSWKDEFIIKLKDDLRAEKANVPILVTEIMPKECKNGIYFKNGVYICTYPFVLILAEILRHRLIEVARERFISNNRVSKADELYEYVMGHEFRQQIEAAIEVYIDMKKQLDREKRTYQSAWETREEQINRLLRNTARTVGKISGVAGSEFPQIKGLDMLESGEKK
ncbi:hypothetical protein A2866_02980 [Candidatus Roizmanbacteria bacterium RIFCSPHIGHO2_01_FULL_39_8]|uniref:DUF2130 domain-containing protein n=1 Tax=Candidatus Roizmanbacteria bacterium RIFCSPHIGHO2_01_FULL_39_8 TaxID=1802033 RepID=A0A1F7GGI7_9BACT|nr:MAG: hypothetical protein A2866_02980 [Candidatus Roizmanbacteria bacterium RIFCSPHIGHO2_01_FULL_39_8]